LLSSLKEKAGIELRLICNESFIAALAELRAVALKETKDLKSSVMRLFQIEEKLKKYLSDRSRKSKIKQM
jgi:hypothetical protein